MEIVKGPFEAKYEARPVPWGTVTPMGRVISSDSRLYLVRSGDVDRCVPRAFLEDTVGTCDLDACLGGNG